MRSPELQRLRSVRRARGAARAEDGLAVRQNMHGAWLLSPSVTLHEARCCPGWVWITVEALAALGAGASTVDVRFDEVGIRPRLCVTCPRRPVVGDVPHSVEPDAIQHPEGTDGHLEDAHPGAIGILD